MFICPLLAGEGENMTIQLNRRGFIGAAAAAAVTAGTAGASGAAGAAERKAAQHAGYRAAEKSAALFGAAKTTAEHDLALTDTFSL